LPRSDNPVLRLSRALVKLADAEQPVRLTGATRRYLRDLSAFPEYDWLVPLLPRLENAATVQAAAGQIRARDLELDAGLHTTVTPTMLNAGIKINMIPSSAEAQVDVRRLPSETAEEVLARFRQIVGDPAVEIALVPGAQLPATESSPRTSAAYRSLERAIGRAYPRQSAVVPFMSRGATDGSFLRSHGVAVYGVPIFLREPGESREHGNDERISIPNIESGAELLWQMVLETAGDN
jgi:acetylornithine deacetylase/succinyl-diaminopimelate desuccinylase-like protein